MKIISVVGYSNSGKTTVIEELVPLLKAKGYSVGTIKNIHCADYNLDEAGTDTWRHKEAGADVTIGYGQCSTDIMIQKRVDIKDLVGMFNFDYLFLEGVTDLSVPRIVTAKNRAELKPFMNGQVIAVSGVIAGEIRGCHGYSVVNVLKAPHRLLEMVISEIVQKEA